MIRPGIRSYFRLRAKATHVSQEVEEEIAHHLEQRVQDLVVEGYSPDAARAEAERRFGALSHARLTLQRRAMQREYRLTMREWLRGLVQDSSYSARSLSREPMIALVIIGTLALGIGANAGMFGIIDELLLRGPAHVVDSNNVRRVYFTHDKPDGAFTTDVAGYVAYELLRASPAPFAGVAAYNTNLFRVGVGVDAKAETVGQATSDMFGMLGVKPVLGRFYTAAEDHAPAGRNVAVLDWDYWQRTYGGDRAVLGHTIVLNGDAYDIIGVAPQGFSGPDRHPVSMWLPMSVGLIPSSDWSTSWNVQWLSLVVRLRDDIPAERAASLATARVRAAMHGAADAGLTRKAGPALDPVVSLSPLSYAGNGKESPEYAITRWLLAVTVIVLLISCANVANLLLARAVRRRREIGVRLALGISRARLARLLLTESVLLAACGGAAAFAIAWWGGELLRKALLPDVAWSRTPLNSATLVYSALVIVTTGVVVGFAPALQALRHDVAGAMRGGSREGGGMRSPLRSALTVVQAALSMVLLIGAGLFVHSLWNVRNLDLGIDASRIISASVSFAPLDGTPTHEQRVAEKLRRNTELRAMAERLRARPDVESASVAVGTPFGNAFRVDLQVPGYDSIPTMPGGTPFIAAVGEDYFATMGTKLLRGRAFTSADRAGSEPVAIVSETMARTLWPREDALTKCLIIGDAATHPPCARVIGVVHDTHRNNLREPPAFQYYIPFGQENGFGGSTLMIRPRGASGARLLGSLSQVLHGYSAGITFVDASVLQEQVDAQARPWRLGAIMFCSFGLLALLIAATGLFSVIAYNVAQRRAELSIRLALGARTASIIGLVVRQGVGLAALGILIGLFLALLTGRRMQPLLFDTSAHDVFTFAVVSVVLLVTAVLACIVPGLRARSVDPAEVLRAG